MIDKEAYVSFEVAKLLKEKGFDWRCVGYYVDDEPDNIKYSYLRETNSDWESRCCSAPTQQMTMKWLRETHDLIIYIKLVNDGDIYYDAWGFTIYNKFTKEYLKSSKLWFKYEEACEAALKYSLENLI